MTIQYAIETNFNDLIVSIENLDNSILADGVLSAGRGRNVSYHIQDENFNSEANITLQWRSGIGYVGITIITAMSGFTYTIKPSAQDGVCIATYEGAYQGFLSQNLIPKCLMPESLDGGLLVLHSTGCSTLKEYADKKGAAPCSRFIK